MLYFDGDELEKKSSIKKNYDRSSDKGVVILPLTEFLISKLGMLQKNIMNKSFMFFVYSSRLQHLRLK